MTCSTTRRLRMQVIEEKCDLHIELRSWAHDFREMTAVIIEGVQVGKQFSALGKTDEEIDKIIGRRIDKYLKDQAGK
jgi:hypothetical protein